MKKLLIVLALAGASFTASAQDEPVLKHSVATNSFWSNWFIQVGGQWNAWYGNQEHGYGGNSSSPFAKFRSNPGAAVAIGKWFTPGLGLRTKVQGIWGRSVMGEVNGVAVKDHSRFNKFWTLNEHVMFNVSNMVLGYNPNRVWNLIPFAGAGFSRTMTHNLYAMQLSVGVLNTFRISNKVAVNLELGWNRYEEDMDGYGDNGNGMAGPDYLRGWEEDRKSVV